jgi:hypothetical protein
VLGKKAAENHTGIKEEAIPQPKVDVRIAPTTV